MKLLYTPLFRVTIRHGYYGDGLTRGDFAVAPTPATRRHLRDYGLVFRPNPRGFTVYAEVEPDAEPPTPVRPVLEDAPVFRFTLRLVRPAVLNVTDLPEHAVGETVFVFDNLRDDQADDRRHLGDVVDGDRVGGAAEAVFQPVYRYRFETLVSSATLTVTDRFGNERAAVSETWSEPVDAMPLDLAVARLSPGRYRISDDHGGHRDLYFDSELRGAAPFGVIELFSRTDTLTLDASEQVPADYRFLDGSGVTGNGDYVLQLEPRATTWRYVVVKRYDASPIGLADLTIDGGGFSRALGDGEVVFESDAEVRVLETHDGFDLHENGTKLLDLPTPGLQTPLQEGAAEGHYTSEFYLYV